MKKIVLMLMAVLLFSWQGLSFASSSVDALIQKLKDKGILTDQEAVQLKGEVASNEKSSQEMTFKTMAPEWLSGLKISGDFRLRDQLERKKSPVTTAGLAYGGHSATYDRGRIRARLNFEDQVNDKVKIVVGIATGGEKNGIGTDNARSNNYTFGGNNAGEGSFGKPGIVLNKAYAVYKPASYVTIMGGKLDNPIWEPASLLWDPDITPEGGAVQLEKRLNDYITPFSTNAVYVLKDWKDETATQYTTGSAIPASGYTIPKTDPYMFITQDGIKGNLTEKVYYKVAGSYYDVVNPSQVILDGGYSTALPAAGGSTAVSAGGNTLISNSPWQYKYSYDLVGGAVDLGINDPFGEMLPSFINIPQVGVMGSFFQNVSPGHNNKAWLMGGYAGNSAINGFGTWKLQSYYKVLESDSWLACFPDDDFYSGNTNTAGWRSQMDIGLAKNVWFTMSMFNTDVFKHANTPGKSVPQQLYQFDLNFKF
jgi:hypothetical protein